jgi:hypothetical protein
VSDQKTELLIGGGVLLAIVGAIAYAGRSSASSTGATFAKADPNAVAAAMNGVAQEITANNAAVTARAQIASSTILGLAGLQEKAQEANLAVTQTRIVTDAQTQQIGLQTSSAAAIAKVNADRDLALSNNAVTMNAQTTKAQIDQSNNQATIAQRNGSAQKTSAIAGAVSGIVNTIASVFHHL